MKYSRLYFFCCLVYFQDWGFCASFREDPFTRAAMETSALVSTVQRRRSVFCLMWGYILSLITGVPISRTSTIHGWQYQVLSGTARQCGPRDVHYPLDWWHGKENVLAHKAPAWSVQWAPLSALTEVSIGCNTKWAYSQPVWAHVRLAPWCCTVQ